MRKRSLSIRTKLVLAFGTCAALMLLIALTTTWWLCQDSSPIGSGARNAGRLVLLLAAAGLTIVFFSGLHLAKVICSGLDRMGALFENIASTLDLSRRSAPPRMDEFGRAAAAFDRFMLRVEEAVSAVNASTDSVSAATREIALGNINLSNRTEQQAASLQNTVATMTTLSQMVVQNAQCARQASALMVEATKTAVSGSTVVEKMVALIERINDSSREISHITEMIEGIAFQTNILALNAAVEAARASDHGKGFAVVANEVRSLAQRSDCAAKEIKALIDSSVREIRAGLEQAFDVSRAMAGIMESISCVATMVCKISSASGQQSKDIEGVNRSLVQIDLVTQKNAALVEQAASAAQALEDQAASLVAVVTLFKLPERVNRPN